ncbi:hypothetical protein [Mycolicibacterium baixiangningiae]|uniref:hypothetical protein n=1 Tax=Mycolicibacterium baixiangningiae TaxID=2761578 RepID=UPI0018D19908|nr:hypothetical protein [Mycolicibacterium baixiangningiae]
MSVGVPCYLVEWYQAVLSDQALDETAARLNDCATSMSAGGCRVQLLTMLAVPTDEVVFGVFTATSEGAVTRTCDCAGLPAQRVTTATEVEFPREP